MQGLPGAVLGSKLRTAFVEHMGDSAARITRTHMTQHGGSSGGRSAPSQAAPTSVPSGSRCAETCAVTTAGLIAPCLVQLVDMLAQCMDSYHAMAAWHAAGAVQQRAKALAVAATAQEGGNSGGDPVGVGHGGSSSGSNHGRDAGSGDGQSCGQRQQPSTAQLGAAHVAAYKVLEAAATSLEQGRFDLASAAVGRVEELVLAATGARGAHGDDLSQACCWLLASMHAPSHPRAAACHSLGLNSPQGL